MNAMLSVCAAALCAAGMVSVQASTIPWLNPDGTADSFSWSDGCNQTGCFGSPTAWGDMWMFLGCDLGVTSEDGLPDQTFDQMNVDVFPGSGMANPLEINGFPAGLLFAYGMYSVDDPQGTGMNGVEITFTLSIDSSMPYSYRFERSRPGWGLWFGWIPYEHDSFAPQAHLSVDANVEAFSDGTGGMAAATAGMTIFHFLPEASSAMFFMVLGLILLRR